MKIECPQCGKSLGPDQIDEKVNIVTCDACGAVFSPPIQNADGAWRKPKRDFSDIPAPSHFDVRRDVTSLEISYRLNSCGGIALAFFAVFWNGMLWTIFVPAFGGIGFSAFGADNFQAEFLLFPLFLIPFILVGIFVAVQALIMLVNTTTIHVDNKALTITHKPIPLPFTKIIPTDMIEQIYTKRKVTRGSNGTQISYQVHMVTRDGTSKKLLAQIPQAEQALYIEQQIETFLHIEDRPVGGEYHGKHDY